MWSEVVERDGEGDQSVRVIADDLLLAGKGIRRRFAIRRIFDPEEQGCRGVTMGLQHQPVVPIISIANAKRLDEGVVLVYVVPQLGMGVGPLVQANGARGCGRVMVGQSHQNIQAIWSGLQSFDVHPELRHFLGDMRGYRLLGSCNGTGHSYEAQEEGWEKDMHGITSLSGPEPQSAATKV